MTRSDIRKQSRLARQNLSPAEQQQAASLLAQQFQRTLSYRKANSIGLYLSFDGEISTTPIIEQAWRDKKAVYLPILPRSGRHMRFARFTKKTELRANKFGIWEPYRSPRIASWAIDVVGMPLVAFDQEGNRMGMGGGFYDTTFAIKHQHGFGPRLVGFAHEVQRHNKLPTEAWDVPLDAILTGFHHYGRG